jgi:hypothetical protein
VSFLGVGCVSWEMSTGAGCAFYKYLFTLINGGFMAVQSARFEPISENTECGEVAHDTKVRDTAVQKA